MAHRVPPEGFATTSGRVLDRATAFQRPRRVGTRTLIDFTRLSGRYWTVVAGVQLVISAALAPAAIALVDGAMAAAGLDALTDRDALLLVSTPASAALLAASALLVGLTTTVWMVLLVVVADCHINGESPTPRSLGRAVQRGCTRVARTARGWAAVCGLTFMAPFAGIHLFAPGASFAAPPFIQREFMKTDVSAVVWLLLLGAVLAITSFAVLRLPALVVGARRNEREEPRSGTGRLPAMSAIAFAVIGLVALAMPHVAAHVLDSGPDGTPSSLAFDPGRSLVGWIAGQLASMTGALLIVSIAVQRSPAAAGLPPAGVVRQRRRSGAPSGSARAAWASAAFVVLGAVTSLGGQDIAPAQRVRAPVVIAHRGFDRGGPENTLSSLAAAAAFHPDLVEVDVQQTADGEFVASHDQNLTLLAGINRNIGEMSTADVTRVTVHMHGHSDVIPTLPEYVRRARELRVPLLIELKVSDEERGVPAAELVEELDRIGGFEGNMIHSLDAGAVAEMQRVRPEADVGLTVGIHRGPLPWGATSTSWSRRRSRRS